VVQRLQTRHTGPGILLKAVTRHNPELGITNANLRMENFGGAVFSGVRTTRGISDLRPGAAATSGSTGRLPVGLYATASRINCRRPSGCQTRSYTTEDNVRKHCATARNINEPDMNALDRTPQNVTGDTNPPARILCGGHPPSGGLQ
jgi:hypothetical protein